MAGQDQSRITVRFGVDQEDLYQAIADLAQLNNRGVSTQVVVLAAAAIRLMQEEGYQIIDGRLKKK